MPKQKVHITIAKVGRFVSVRLLLYSDLYNKKSCTKTLMQLVFDIENYYGPIADYFFAFSISSSFRLAAL